MPFAVHTMDPGCPVVAIEKTAEEAAATAERLGYDVGSARVLILPCAVTVTEAMGAIDKVAQMSLRLSDARYATAQAEAARDEMQKKRDTALDAVEAIRKRTPERVLRKMERIRDELAQGVAALREDLAGIDTAARPATAQETA
jgi:hypothetical protein